MPRLSAIVQRESSQVLRPCRDEFFRWRLFKEGPYGSHGLLRVVFHETQPRGPESAVTAPMISGAMQQKVLRWYYAAPLRPDRVRADPAAT